MGSSSSRLLGLLCVAVLGAACAPDVRRFPLRAPMQVDTDLEPVAMPCHPDPEDPKHQICVPEPYVSSFAWDGADNIVFRPLAQFFKVDPGGEAMNVNSFDEVPDSAWFINRIGKAPMSLDDLRRGYCDEDVLDAENDPPGSWLIDQGKPNGANPGFRVKVKGKGKFMLKADQPTQPEKGTGATAVAARFYYAAGWWSPCDSIVYIRPELLKLKEGLTVTDNTGISRPFDAAALKALMGKATHRGNLVRMVASKWLPGRTVGPFTYAGTRDDDPNDVIPHEDRRDLRGARVMSAWLNHFDSREQNTMSTWMAVNEEDPDSTPGHLQHWYIDLGDCFGSEWDWDGITIRLGHAYYFDIPYVVKDFLTLGMIERPWDRAVRSLDGEIFAYFSSKDFEPDDWHGGYGNPTFNRMTDLDAAWAARIIARFTPEHVDAAIGVGNWTKPQHHAFLLRNLLERQHIILDRYFQKRSAISDVVVRDKDQLCAVDLARKTATYPADRFAYGATVYAGATLDRRGEPKVDVAPEGELCVPLEHFAPEGADDDAEARYAIVDVRNGASRGPLRAHLYDLGKARGFQLVGLQRPGDDDPPR